MWARVWPWLILICILAAGLRFWRLGDYPSGLYRDEAYNGLDALTVLDGHFPLYFPANNGREPAYIYLTSLSLALLGNTVLAVRLAAAAVGSLTTLLVFALARRWFGPQTALFAAFLWATTVWTIHLSRLGLRVILLAPVLTAAAWLATAAWQKGLGTDGNHASTRWLWLAAGLVYSLSFYTYLAGRFTPALLVAAALLLAFGHGWRRLKPAVIWGGLGILLGLLPLLVAGMQNPEILLGRPGQVSIFNPQINKNDFWGTLWHHWWRALGLFVWRGDGIIRHNPPGRPLFDPLIAVPFLIGLVVMIRRWRLPTVWLTALWVGIMLWPTILAEDAPHFLRSVGILPAVLLIPALGLSEIASWPKLARSYRIILPGLLLAGSLALTVRDYYFVYNLQPDTGYLFEAGAKAMVDDIHRLDQAAQVWVDRRYRDGWPSVSFLLDPQRRVSWIDPPQGDWPSSTEVTPDALFLWPFDRSTPELAARMAQPPLVVDVVVGPLARGDLEPDPYPLYIVYALDKTSDLPGRGSLATFAKSGQSWRFDLVAADVRALSNQKLNVNLLWSTHVDEAIDAPLTVFVHVVDPQSGQLIGQTDAPPAAGYWNLAQLRPGVVIKDRQVVDLSAPLDPDQHQIFVGVYPSGQPDSRLQMTGHEGNLYSEHTVQLNLLQREP